MGSALAGPRQGTNGGGPALVAETCEHVRFLGKQPSRTADHAAGLGPVGAATRQADRSGGIDAAAVSASEPQHARPARAATRRSSPLNPAESAEAGSRRRQLGRRMVAVTAAGPAPQPVAPIQRMAAAEPRGAAPPGETAQAGPGPHGAAPADDRPDSAAPTAPVAAIAWHCQLVGPSSKLAPAAARSRPRRPARPPASKGKPPRVPSE